MNYYEELGIRQDAPVEEIRQAYRALARVLHPDGQVDPKLIAVAERQMQRLGEMVAILSDPEERAEYDAGLLPGKRWEAERDRDGWWEGGEGVAELAVRHWFWIASGVLLAVLGVWNFMLGNPTVVDREVGAAAVQREPVTEAGEREGVPETVRPKRERVAGVAKAAAVRTEERGWVGEDRGG